METARRRGDAPAEADARAELARLGVLVYWPSTQPELPDQPAPTDPNLRHARGEVR
jgi:hypothetical protein